MVESLLIALSIVVVPVSISLWIAALARIRRGQPLIPWTAREPVPWTILDMLAIGVCGIVVVSFCSLAVVLIYPEIRGLQPSQYKVSHHIATIIAFSVASTAVGAFGLFVLRRRARATLVDLGIAPVQIRRDISLGIVVFLMLVVPMLIIQFVATKLIGTDEKHAFIDLILENPNPYILIPVGIAATVVAPIVEEFLFRLLFQGWLERLCTPANSTEVILAERVQSERHASLHTGTPRDELDRAEADERAVRDPVQEADPFSNHPSPDGPGEVEPVEPSVERRWSPIVVSSVAFSIAHFGQGAAPIALFFLALGLGYVYQRTHRILPCMVIHFLVNLLAMVQLAAYTMQNS